MIVIGSGGHDECGVCNYGGCEPVSVFGYVVDALFSSKYTAHVLIDIHLCRGAFRTFGRTLY